LELSARSQICGLDLRDTLAEAACSLPTRGSRERRSETRVIVTMGRKRRGRSAAPNTVWAASISL